MLMRQARLRDDEGSEEIAWIDRDHAIPGQRLTLALGEGERSPPVTVIEAWPIERERAEINERQDNRRSFGGSVR